MYRQTKDCTRQVDTLKEALLAAQQRGEISPDWSFSEQPWVPVPFLGDWHTILLVQSDNPAQPVFALDPWLGVGIIPIAPNQERLLRDKEILRKACLLKPADARHLEKALQEAPSNRDTRLQLVGYYFPKAKNRHERIRRFNHILWFIENEPHEPILSALEMKCDSLIRYTAEQYEIYCKLWLAQAKNHPKDAAVSGNAGNAIIDYDFKRGIKLLLRAAALDPRNHEWPGKLAFHYSQRRQFTPSLSRAEYNRCAKQTIEWGERHLSLVKHRRYFYARVLSFKRSAEAAIHLKDYVAARRYLNRALRMYRPYGDVSCLLRESCTALMGLVCIRTGDTARARECLLALRGNSYIYSSEDEQIILANELITAGETSAVVSYLRLCKRKKAIKTEKIDKWINAMKSGNSITIRVPEVYQKGGMR